MQLTTRSWLLLLATTFPIALMAQAGWWGWVALGWLGLVSALLLADWRLTPDRAAWLVTRRHDDRLSLAANNRIELTVELRRGASPITIWLRDEPPLPFLVEETDRLLTTQVPPRTPTPLTYTVYPPRRGDYRFGDIHLRWESVLRLLRRQMRIPAAEPVKVYPNLVDVKKYDLLLRQNRLWELGLRNARIFGSGAEFERLRDYLPDDEYRRVNWKATARRGDYRFGDIHLRWESVLRLLRRQMRIPAAEPVKVYPNLVDVKKYDLLLRQNRLWELGLRNARIFGSGAEFERLRDYLPDDEYRRVNWKATARRGKPISVEYETERSQHIMVLLDVGRMMRSPVGDVAKLDYAINAILLLAYVAAQKGDKIGLLAFADKVQLWVEPRTGKQQFHRLLEQLYSLESVAVEPDYAQAFSYFAVKQHKRSLVLVFTDLTGSITTDLLIAQMGRIRRQHLPLVVTMRDPTVQRLADQPIADSSTLYQRTMAEQLLDERQLTIERLTQRGILTLDVPADQLSIAVVNQYLALKAQSRI